MSRIRIPKQQLTQLTQEMFTRFPFPVLEKGWDLYAGGAVSGLEMARGAGIEAWVEDGAIYGVRLDLKQFSSSKCDCGSETYCKHMAAVFFFVYGAQGERPEVLMNEFRNIYAAQQKLLERLEYEQARSGKTNAAKEAGHIRPPGREHTVREWQAFFDQKFGTYMERPGATVNSFFREATEQLFAYCAGWDPALQALYKIHALLFIAGQAERNFDPSAQFSYAEFYVFDYEQTMHQCLQQFINIVQETDRDRAKQMYSAHIAALARLLAGCAFPERLTPVDWPNFYRNFWMAFCGPEQWEEEMLRLRRLSDATDLPPVKREHVLSALAFFDFLKGDDMRALEKLDKLVYLKKPEHCLMFLHIHAERQNWEKLLLWMRWAVPLVRRSESAEESFYRCWLQAASRRPLDEGWGDIMIELFPRSYPFYASFLIERRQYALWADFQLYMETPPWETDAEMLRRVEMEDPYLLLPLYHQAVERCISQKNRDSYKTAVQGLAQLRNMYARLNQSRRWNLYLAYILQKYARLRSFRKELEGLAL